MMRPIVIVAAIAVAAPVLGQTAAVQVNGLNVRTAAHALGTYRQGDGRNWSEFDTAGKKTFAFIEEARDEWSVYLFDPARGVRVQIDLYRKKIRYADAGQPYADLYDVTGATAGLVPPPQPRPVVKPAPPGPKWNGGPAYGASASAGSYGVEVGTLTSQSSAGARCTAVARDLNGTWTGQWRSGEPGYPGVCMIRFKQ